VTGDELLAELAAPRMVTPLTDSREAMALLSYARDSARGWPESAGIAQAARIALELADRLAPTRYHARTAEDLRNLVEARRAFRDDASDDEAPHESDGERVSWLADDLYFLTLPSLGTDDDASPTLWRVMRVRLLELVAAAVVALDGPTPSR